MELSISWDDLASPWIEKAIRTFPTYRRSALKSLGWMMQKEIKAGIQSGAPGGKTYTPLSDVGKKRTGERPTLRKGEPRKRVLGKLRNAIGYQYRDGALVVGWLSRTAVYMGSIHEQGKAIPATEKMRRFWWASRGKNRGFRYYGVSHTKIIALRRGTRKIVIPARPTIGPMRAALIPRMGPYIKDKVVGYLTKDMERTTPRSSRKYVVRQKWW